MAGFSQGFSLGFDINVGSPGGSLGGIGHLLEAIEEAKQLAAITKRGPPGFTDLRTAPAFAPISLAPSLAPAVPGTEPIAQPAQMQAAQAAKRKRDIEAILLLAA